MKVLKSLGCVLGAATLLATVSANAQSVTLQAGFNPDPRMLRGVSGGPVPASAFGGSCAGYLPAAPQQRLFIRSPMNFLRVWAHADGDTTLAVRAPTGQVFCADDVYGNDPAVDMNGLMPGRYDVFVGSFSAGAAHPYTVGISELSSSTPQNAFVQPPPPVLFGNPPPVIVGNPPPVIVGNPPPVIIGNSPPVIVGNPPPVIVGNPPPVIVQAPQVPRPFRGSGSMLASGFMPDPRTFGGVSGGPVDASAMGPQCRGWIGVTPSQNIVLTTPFNFLRVWAHSNGDTTLLVRAPTGQVFCADDVYGNDPAVDLNGLPPGSYQIFVGSYGAGQRHAFTLGVTELASSTPTQFAAPQPPGIIAPPAFRPPAQPAYGALFGSVAFSMGFMPDPHVLSGIAGGPISAGSWNGSCRGYIPAQPSHVMQLNSPFQFLRVYASSSADTTLVVRTPSGQLMCADDTFGNNPGVDLYNAMPGTYQVFVGTYSAGNQAPYTISFTEIQGMHP